MSFLLANWGRSSAHANEPIYTLANSVIVGAPRIYSYYTADTQATVLGTNYFAPSQALNICNDVSVGDTIEVYSSTDLTSVSYLVTAVVQSPASVTIVAKTGLITASGTVSSTQILAGLYANPVQIIPAPGANRAIVAVNGLFEYVYGTVQYANGGDIQFQYDSTVHAGGTNIFGSVVTDDNLVAATANNSQILEGAAIAWGLSSAIANKGIFMSCLDGEFTAGNGSINYSVLYRIVNL